ncbi:MAG: DUF1460 domain-containing protein [Deltaproteobacteria bacterium]|nr:DUF1460 domain-containing protein [Deltaproteobacteria bacterium]
MIFLPEDRKICEMHLKAARERGWSGKPAGELVVAAGSAFLGAPYAAGTLERKGPEELVINLRAFDCVTFVENAVVLAGLIRAGRTAFQDYAAALQRIRYRGGRCCGYPSRLHYFTDWLRDNGRKGIVRDITRELGGIPFRKAFHALTDRREEIPPLGDAAAFCRVRSVEAACSRRTLYRIPKARLKGFSGIENGDIIAVATDAEGIDVSHTGIAVRGPRGLHLLHASGAAGKVVLSSETLYRYLISRRSRTGILAGRVGAEITF